jgi:phosphoenolpyruvate carboxylase
MTYTDEQQADHRKQFIDECRQKAWGAACHADWISKGIDELLAQYQKMQEQDRALEGEIKELADALDSHTVANREKRKLKLKERDTLAEQLKALAANAQQGQQAMQQLLQSVETNLALATHAEKWTRTEIAEAPLDLNP